MDFQKYNIKRRKKNKVTKIIKIYVYEVALKIRVFFYKVIEVIKMKIKGVIENLKIKKIKNDNKHSKNISRTFSGVVVGSMGSVHFRIVPWSSLYFSSSIGPFLCSRY